MTCSNRYLSRLIFVFLLAPTFVRAWFSCEEVDFCTRIRNNPSEDVFTANLSAIVHVDQSHSFRISNNVTGKSFNVTLTPLESKTFRVIIDDPSYPRHRVLDALDGNPTPVASTMNQTSNELEISTDDGTKAIIQASPFRIDFYYRNELITQINSRGLLTFEESEPEVAVAVDFYFPGAQRAYGLPSHPDRLALRNTGPGGVDPYRFYNIDHAAYEVETTQAVYGAIPVLYAHSTAGTSGTTQGVFWYNTAQTFVDLNRTDDGLQALFFSESGVIDFFVLSGPTLKETVQQYAKLTGVAPLPQYFALGYHQSRYNYESIEDVETVITELDNNNFPVDVIWLDIEYTDAMKYFTWHPQNFADPIGLQTFLNNTGRKLVAIIDPHIYVQEGYFVYDEAEAAGYFVKNSEGTSYIGECWPGLSSWIDFFDPAARAYYASLYSFDRFNGSTDILHIWNDMNEPAVFNAYEGSMPKDNVHYGGWLHRDVHNQYGFYQTMGTYQGLVARMNGTQRPFILTRAHFAGSQRYTAMWTGDNVAEFRQLDISIPMCLSEALGGLSFCGADIGGFLQNPSEELLQKWYQAAAWLPFFRQHSSIDTERREPYLYDSSVQNVIRYAIQLRYFHLPYWYTEFYEHYRTGEPVIRPLIYAYPTDQNALDIDLEWLVGDDILVRPAIEENAQQVSVYFPGGSSQIWYDVENTLLYRGNGFANINVNISSNVYFYRGGSIVPRRNTVRQSSVATLDDPITLYVFLNDSAEANGTLYVDDATTFQYTNKKYLYLRFDFSNNTLSSGQIDEDASYDGSVSFGNTIVYRPPSGVKAARIFEETRLAKTLEVSYGPDEKYLNIENINIDLKKPFKIQLV